MGDIIVQKALLSPCALLIASKSVIFQKGLILQMFCPRWYLETILSIIMSSLYFVRVLNTTVEKYISTSFRYNQILQWHHLWTAPSRGGYTFLTSMKLRVKKNIYGEFLIKFYMTMVLKLVFPAAWSFVPGVCYVIYIHVLYVPVSNDKDILSPIFWVLKTWKIHPSRITFEGNKLIFYEKI